MPEYVYRCPNCGAQYEITHSIADCEDSKFFCPDCEEVMARVPQPFRWGTNPWDVLYRTHFEPGYADWRQRQDKKRAKEQGLVYRRTKPL